MGVGTVTATQGSDALIFDATAIAAINSWQAANPYVLSTQMQFRIAVGGIYSLIQYDPIAGGATLDRPFGDPGGSGLAFQLYQLYYATPYADFRAWLTIRNPSMYTNFDLTATRSQIDAVDPQRTWYQFPTKAVAFMRDQRGAGTTNASATLGFPLFELWGQPVTPFTYQCYGIRLGADLVQPTDTLPLPITEDLVAAMARVYAYEWAEANKDMAPRAVGPDFRFLIGEAKDVYRKLLTEVRREDREYCDNYYAQTGLNGGRVNAIYNTIAGVASPYGPF